ncbi:MAG TPA: SLC13 family permease, partial [Candidatus Polarisedimenticolaceae bacterium]|nr:SLC13 family permease [Candidatus Polarisedimenticolaceae bacterium]
GFSNPAVVTIMMMFILSEGLVQSGVVTRIGYALMRLAGRATERAHWPLLLVTASISAFINNTAAVSLFIPVALSVAKHFRLSPSKVLLPLSYSAIFGGTCTLIGTSTNILVSTLAVDHGLAPFTVFEFLRVGVFFFVGGMAFNFFLAPRLLPDRTDQRDLTGKYRMGSYLTELRVARGSDLIGRTLKQERFGERYHLSVLEIVRGGAKIVDGIDATPLGENDVLIVSGKIDDILSVKERRGLLMLTDVKLGDAELADRSNVLAEIQLSPRSDLLGATLKEIDFRRRFGCFVLALNRTGDVIREKLTSVPLHAWDTLLVFGPRASIEAQGSGRDFVLLQELPVRLRLMRRWWIGAATVPAVVALAAFDVTSIMVSAILGVALLLATRTLRIHQAYQSIDWTVIFLLVTVLPVGVAIESTGLAAAIGEGIVRVGQPLGAWVVLSLVILATSLLTEAITNNSAAVLMVPICVSAAHELGVDPKPFVMGVTFAASMSFATPTGYQTNTMVYGPGSYRFTDYLRVGVPLNLLFWALASVLIPVVWPF